MSERRTLISPYTDTNFQVGDSPVVLPIETDLGQAATRGFVACDGVGNIEVEIACGGGYNVAFVLKTGEVFDIEGLVVSIIRLVHTGTDSAYRVVVA